MKNKIALILIMTLWSTSSSATTDTQSSHSDVCTARAFVLQVRAQCYSTLKQPDLALQDQKEALALEPPKDVWTYVMLGAYYRELEQYDLSLAALKEALKFDEDGPNSGPGMAVYYHTGQTYHASGALCRSD